MWETTVDGLLGIIMNYELIFWPEMMVEVEHPNELFVSYKHTAFIFTWH